MYWVCSFPRKGSDGDGRKQSLKVLASKLLCDKIQQAGADGHDSSVTSQAVSPCSPVACVSRPDSERLLVVAGGCQRCDAVGTDAVEVWVR